MVNHLLKALMCLGLAFSVVACEQAQPKKEDKKMAKKMKKAHKEEAKKEEAKKEATH